MKRTLKAGIIGCGNISQAYFDTFKKLDTVEIKYCADLEMQAAEAKGKQNNVRAVTVAELLGDPEIEIVINLSTPQAHAGVNLQALEAGKHVYCEKPYTVTRKEGMEVLARANEKNLLTGCAPDTFLGAGLQTARKLVVDGCIGRPVAGTAFMCCHGHESWHPNPGFYYINGGGPLFDMGPYYLTALVHLLGPVKRVAALCGRGFTERLATSEEAKGQKLPVEVDTHTAGTLEFHNGAIITMVMSFDVWKHDSRHIEIHGTEGSLSIPDPNCFGGTVSLFNPVMEDWQEVPWTHDYSENMRGIGVADMAAAIQSGSPPRCSGEMAYHVLDVMHAFGESSESGRHITVQSSCAQPEPMPLNLSKGKSDE